MKYNRYVECLFESGFRELGYFNGLRVFLGPDMLITVEEIGGGFRLSIDSVAQNIGEVYFVSSDYHLCGILEAYIS